MQPHKQSAGFAVIEVVLAVIVIVGLLAVLGLVYGRLHQPPAPVASAPQQKVVTNDGSTTSIDTLTQNDVQGEAKADSSGDSMLQSDALSANSAQSNVGSAYNENTL